MDELDNAAILEPMIISAPEELGTSSGETCVELNDSSVRMAAGGFYEADKENEEDQRCGSTQRSSASEPLAMDIKPDEGAEERRAMRMPDGTRRMTEEHYHETMEAIRRAL